MPCESCNVQFTVFRRKRSCAECKRYYCSSCLSASKRRGGDNTHFSSVVFLCNRCLVFAKRPLLRADLLQLKPKDLIFYLQSKHISTTGCVEKDELVGLVLAHVQQVDEADAASSNSRSHGNANTNSFDNLKQTCQNIFTSITENISDSFIIFESKPTNKNDAQHCSQDSAHSSTDNESTHIFDQPRVSTREIPTYASYQNSNHITSTQSSTSAGATRVEPSTSPRATLNHTNSSSTSSVTTKPSCQAVSPALSLSLSDVSREVAIDGDHNEAHASTSSQINHRNGCAEADEMQSDCECSDEEMIQNFSERIQLRKKDECAQMNSMGADETDIVKADNNGCEMSSQSSFEELGAIGGISDESKATTDTNSSNVEHWQFLDNAALQVACATHVNLRSSDEEAIQEYNRTQAEVSPKQKPVPPQRVKKVTRRRSDSYLNRQRQHPASEDDSPTDVVEAGRDFLTGAELDLVQALSDTEIQTTVTQKETKSSNNCHNCGKRKASLRRQVEKMRRHLESSQMSEADIKSELKDFLVYLDQRTKSVECSDVETAASSVGSRNCAQISVPATPIHNYQRLQQEEQQPWEYELDENDGIHVYAGTSLDDNNSAASRFINLEDFDTIDDLESLSVKQLKEVLMLNRVDYKGCCEKQELLDRVQRLWKNLKSAPAIEKLQTDELCKICMDAPIECVILECGHMATCTNCGKVLSECPICRQYIVRVVRFFRA